MKGLLHIFTRWNDVLGHINTSGWVEVEYTNTYPTLTFMEVFKSTDGECLIEYIRSGGVQTIGLAVGQTYNSVFTNQGMIKVRYRDVKSLSIKLQTTGYERTIVIV